LSYGDTRVSDITTDDVPPKSAAIIQFMTSKKNNQPTEIYLTSSEINVPSPQTLRHKLNELAFAARYLSLAIAQLQEDIDDGFVHIDEHKYDDWQKRKYIELLKR